jgi:hypothetical protein
MLRSATGRLHGASPPSIEHIPPNVPYSLDFLARLGEAFRCETLESEEVILDGIRARVATPAPCSTE